MYRSYLKRHYDRFHGEMHSISESNRKQLLEKLKKDFRLKNLRHNRRCASSSINCTVDQKVKATYIISLALAKKRSAF